MGGGGERKRSLVTQHAQFAQYAVRSGGYRKRRREHDTATQEISPTIASARDEIEGGHVSTAKPDHQQKI